MTQRFQNFIAGKHVDADDKTAFPSVNPGNRNDQLGLFPRSKASDVEQAVGAAKEAYRPWARRPAPERGAIVMRFAGLLAQQSEELAKLITRETGKSIRESRGEVQASIDTVQYWALESRRLFGETIPSEVEGKFTMTIRCPIGPTAVISAWNVPLIMAAQKVIPALVAGNTVVYKPSEDTPALANLLVDLLVQSGIPSGVINLVHGFGNEAGRALVDHPDIRLITFTGGTGVGRQISARAGEALKRVSLEMGGKNCVIVLDDADVDAALRESVRSAFATTGQRCSAASRILVHRSIFDNFAEQFVDRVKSLRVGDGMDERTDVGPVINERQLTKVHDYAVLGVKEGAEILTGGTILEDAAYRDGYFHAPTVFASVTQKMRIAREEIFGPITALMPVDDLDQALAIANDVEHGLVGSIFTRDIRRAFWAMREFETGVVSINRGTAGTESHLPFGGVKGSGVGYREGGGKASVDTFTEWKTVLIDYSGPH
jgi:aldehyde dehydrogenase (NAD+)